MAKLGSVHVGMPKDAAGTAELCTPGLENARGRARMLRRLNSTVTGKATSTATEGRTVLCWAGVSTRLLPALADRTPTRPLATGSLRRYQRRKLLRSNSVGAAILRNFLAI